MARKPRDYKPIEFRQLCAIVKMLLQQEPSIDDAEWKARTKDHLRRLGFDEPNPEMLARSMTQVEHALKQTIGSREIGRPVPLPSQPEVSQSAPYQETRTNRPAGWEIVMGLMRQLSKVSPVSESTSSRPLKRELLGITEVAALDEFWRQVRMDVDKIALLRAYAEVAIVRPEGWNHAAIRTEFERMRFNAGGCFVCRFEQTHQHHVIQIQHGGSNYIRNLVALCVRCHATVHPWIGKSQKRHAPGWTALGDISIDELIARERKPA